MSDKTKFGKFLSKVKDILPEAGNVGVSILTGNYVGAVKEVGQILSKNKDKSEEIKQLDLEFQILQNEFETEKYAKEVEDRKSARDREVEMAKTGKTDWLMYATGLTALGSFVLIVYATIFIEVIQNNKLFIHLMGMVEGAAISIFSFYFGSSKGSKDKDKKL